MADDRLFIKCKGCGGWKMLLKHMVGTGLTHRDNGILEWLDTHAECHKSRYEIDLGDDACFTLHTEGALGVELQWDKQNMDPTNMNSEKPNPSCFKKKLGVEACTHGCPVSTKCYE